MKFLSKTPVLLLIALAIGIAVGRYSNRPAETTKIVHEETKKVIDTKKKIIEVVTPDGTKTTTTTEDTVTTIDKDKTKSSQTKPSPKVNLSFLAGVPRLNDLRPIYGLSVSKEFIGPITVGLFGLTNGTLGVSIGVDF